MITTVRPLELGRGSACQKIWSVLPSTPIGQRFSPVALIR
jgi:hypothetical protein